jgi:hypothetical protein
MSSTCRRPRTADPSRTAKGRRSAKQRHFQAFDEEAVVRPRELCHFSGKVGRLMGEANPTAPSISPMGAVVPDQPARVCAVVDAHPRKHGPPRLLCAGRIRCGGPCGRAGTRPTLPVCSSDGWVWRFVRNIPTGGTGRMTETADVRFLTGMSGWRIFSRFRSRRNSTSIPTRYPAGDVRDLGAVAGRADDIPDARVPGPAGLHRDCSLASSCRPGAVHLGHPPQQGQAT